MPTINDATVVNSAYDTSGNGGRKLVRLENGTLVSVVDDTASDQVVIYKSTDNGLNWTQVCYSTNSSKPYIIPNGNKIHLLFTFDAGFDVFANTIDITTQTNVDIWAIGRQTVSSDGTAMGTATLAINEAKTELHASWSDKTPTYPNSMNIRYSKGTILSDGSVTWGAVKQVSAINSSGTDLKNPSISVKDGHPYIAVELAHSSVAGLYILTTSFTTKDSAYTNLQIASDWGNKLIYQGGTYAQLSPSAIFVPQSVNGLANGRIELTWMGKDATDSAVFNIRYSYSDDGGVTWSSVEKKTSGNTYSQEYPSITANKTNEIFILFTGQSTVATLADYRIKQIKKSSGGTWGSVIDKKTPKSIYPSTLYDSTFNFTEPLFIYQDATKVGFYGTWTVTTISVTQGSIGQKTDKANVLTYAITTDGVMSTITEKVNGVTVGTKTATSGQSQIVGLTQAQWDAVKFGKYDALTTLDLLPKDTGSWEQGQYGTFGNGSTPSELASTIRIRPKGKVNGFPAIGNKEYTLSIGTGYRAILIQVDNNGKSVGYDITWKTDGFKLITQPSTKAILIFISKTDDSTITASDIVSANPKLTYTTYPLNTLTVEMGSETYTYTFDKRLATTDDILSAVKAEQDVSNVFLPAVKSKLASAITSKGGTASGTDTWDALESAVESMSVKKIKTGTFTISGATVSITGLGFVPRILFIKLADSYFYLGFSDYHAGFFGWRNSILIQASPAPIRDSDGFTIPLHSSNFPNGTWQYYAGE